MADWLLKGGYPVLLAAHLGLLVFLTLLCSLRLLGQMSPAGRLGLLGVALGAALVRLAFAPAPVVWFDEFYYVATAQNMLEQGVAGPLVLHGYPPGPEPVEHFLPPYPRGWPFLISLALVLPQGTPWLKAAGLSMVLHWLAVLAFYCLAVRRLGTGWAMVGAGFLAVLPPLLKLASASLEMASLASLALALLALGSVRDDPTPAGLLWLAVAVTFAAEIRPENSLYVVPFMLAAWPGARRLRIRTRLAAVLTAGVLMLPVGLVLGDALSNPEGSGHFTYHPLPGYSVWENRLSSLGYNLLFFLDNRKWPLALTILALVGLVSGAARPVGGAWLTLWVAAMTGLFTVVHYGDFSSVNALDSWRFAHHTFLPLTLLALAGLAWLWGRGRAGQGAALILAAWALAAPWAQSAFLHQRHFLAELWDASAEVARRLPPEALVAVETADYFCLFAYGRGLQAVVGPLPRPPRGPFYVFAQARSLGSIWDNLALVPVEYWKGRRDYLLLRAPGPAPGRRG